MIEFLFSLEGLTSFIAFIAAVWGLRNKIKASRALRKEAEVRAEAASQREKLLKEISELHDTHKGEMDELQERLDVALTTGREDMALMRGQIGKLMDMILSGEEMSVEAEEGNVKIKGSAGEVDMKEGTLNKVAEATTGMKYKRTMGGKLKRVPS